MNTLDVMIKAIKRDSARLDFILSQYFDYFSDLEIELRISEYSDYILHKQKNIIDKISICIDRLNNEQIDFILKDYCQYFI